MSIHEKNVGMITRRLGDWISAWNWYARKFGVMENALTIFAIIERGQALTSKERHIIA